MLAVLCLLAGSQARADKVHLVGGTVIEGKAVRQGDKVVVELEAGEMSLPASEVERIEPSESVVQHFEAQYAKLRPGDVKGLLTLADYCRDHQMRDRERQMLLKVVEVSPDHAEARARLGYVHTDAGWVTREDQMRAQGMVLHEGQWVTRAQLIEMERLQAQADTAAHERDKAQAELETKRVELEKARVERDQAAASAEQSTPTNAATPPPAYYGYGSYGYGYAAPPYAYAPHAGYGGRDGRRCLDPPRCARTAPAWPHHSAFPIPGVKDPFDYLH